MQKSMFNILFDFRGEINNRQYRYGIIAILFSVFVTLHHSVITVSQTLIIQKLGVESMGRWSINSQLINNFFPSFIPFGFIIFYCSIILTIKRIRSFNRGRIFGVFLGFLTFLAVKSLLTIPILTMLFQRGAFMGINPIFYLITFGIFFLFGLSIVILLSFLKPCNSYGEMQNSKYSFSFYGSLKDFEYVAHMGRLYSWSFMAGVVFAILAALSVYLHLPKSEIAWTLSGLICISIIILCIYYTNISIRRIRDIGLKGRWVPIILLFYIVLMAGAGALQHFSMNENLVFGLCNLIKFLAMSLWALQFLLFIVPGKQLPNL